MSLLEVLIVSALITVTALVAAEMFTNLTKAMNAINAHENLFSLQDSLRTAMFSNVNCVTALGTKDFKFSQAQHKEEKGQPISMNLPKGPSLAAGSAVNGYDLKTEIFNFSNAYDAGSITIGPTLFNRYHVDIWGEFSPTQTVLGPQTFKGRHLTSIIVAVNSTNNKVEDCYSEVVAPPPAPTPTPSPTPSPNPPPPITCSLGVLSIGGSIPGSPNCCTLRGLSGSCSTSSTGACYSCQGGSSTCCPMAVRCTCH